MATMERVRPTSVARPTFAQVYEDHFEGVWRFVRSRVGDHHAAQDVTSDVFVRAWRSWDRFDHTRGRVEPWLFTIAHRAIVDHWRRPRPEPTEHVDVIDITDDFAPDHHALSEDLLHRLGAALEQLQPRERDALAMRFAARLPVDDIAGVLGLRRSAAKMLLHRAVLRLRRLVDHVDAPNDTPADLEGVIDDILARGRAAMDDSDLHGLLVHLSVVHERPTPDHLGRDVAACVECEAEGTSTSQRADGSRRSRLLAALAALLAFAPLCLACTVMFASNLLTAAGLGAAAMWFHEASLLAAVAIAWVVARARHRHGGTLGFRLAATGAALALLHGTYHLGFHFPSATGRPATAPLFELPGGAAFYDWSNRVAVALLVAGAAASWAEGRRWRRAEAALLRRAAGGSPVAAAGSP